MIQEILKAFSLIFMAEMGDKTQILAMAFATQYPVRKVLLGIGLGAFLNHGLAVLLGSLLSSFINIEVMQTFAGFAFIGFSVWTLKIENDEEEKETKKNNYGPLITVAIAFFIGELGDKTQLTAITLAADSVYPALVLVGTVSGMIATGALGIIVGKKLGDKIPELAIKYLASTVFLIFGFQKLYTTLPDQYLVLSTSVPFVIIVLSISSYLAYKLYQHHQTVTSRFLQTSQKLYDYYQHISMHLDQICMGEHYCKACLGEHCAIGHAKEVIKESLEHPNILQNTTLQSYTDKPFNEDEILDALVDTLMIIEEISDEKRIYNANLVRQQLEMAMLHQCIESYLDQKDYVSKVSEIDPLLGFKIRGLLFTAQKSE